MSGKSKKQDTTAAGARGIQNIIFGSFSKRARQSLSLPSNCERTATPSSIVEHNLAAAALKDMPVLSWRARSTLFGPLGSSTYATVLPKNVISQQFARCGTHSFHSLTLSAPNHSWPLPFSPHFNSIMLSMCWTYHSFKFSLLLELKFPTKSIVQCTPSEKSESCTPSTPVQR